MHCTSVQLTVVMLHFSIEPEYELEYLYVYLNYSSRMWVTLSCIYGIQTLHTDILTRIIGFKQIMLLYWVSEIYSFSLQQQPM